MPVEPPGPYRVVCPGVILQTLRRWAERAAAAGVQAEFAASLRFIQERLSTEPLAWGEERFTLPGRNVRVRHGARLFLHVSYGVDVAARVVFVRTFLLLPNAPFEDIS
ncbi:MAG TPA: hypothetical protein VFW33_18425 [Gemmataceae bacterium]|nr:hypothetical protein [Gemmataceae bacterium]